MSVQIPRKTVIGKLQPTDVTDSKVTNISWTTDGTTTTSKPAKLLCLLPESSFQPKHNINQYLVVLKDTHILQEAKDGLSSILKGECNNIISKSPTYVGRANLFQMDIPTAGPPVAHKPYPIPLKYQKFVDKEIKLLENAGCKSKSLRLWDAPVIKAPKSQMLQTPVSNSFIKY